MFPPELQVMKFVAEVNGAFGARWRVFTTGSSRHYLFVLAQNPLISRAVLRSELLPEVCSALARGHGHAS